MLQYMRQRASSWIIKVILSIIVLAFIFMGVGNFRESRDTVVARVNGEIITAMAFQDRYYDLLENVRQQFGDNLNDDMLKMLNLRERALEQLINESVLLQQAADYGLLVTDAELARSINAIPAFQRNGRFDKTLYTQLLQRNRIMPEVFEQNQRKQLLINKMLAIITDSVKVSEDEARRWHEWDRTRVSVNYVSFFPETHQDIDISQEVLTQYYDEHKQAYQTPARTGITFLSFAPEQSVDRVKVDAFEVERYYAEHQDRYRNEKTVEASHVLIRADGDAPETLVEEKRQKALQVYDKINNDGLDFAAAAREFSECPSAQEGGQLGAFERRDMVAPFSDRAFAMAAGEISEPVRTQFGWHLIKVDRVNEASVTSLSDAEDEIRALIVINKARDLAYEEALRAFDKALDGNSVQEAARVLGLTAVTTSLFTAEGPIREIPDSARLARQASVLQEGEISDVEDIDGTCYLFQVDERLESQIPELETVREKVTADLKKRLQNEKAAQEAERFLTALKKENRSMMEIAEEEGLKMETTGVFSRREAPPGIGHLPGLSEAVFLLTPADAVADSVFSGRGGYYVVALAELKIPGADAFAAAREQTTKALRQQKKDQALEQWLADMRDQSTVTIKERFLSR